MTQVDLDAFLSALGLTIKNTVAGGIASFVALNFWQGLKTKRERWTTFIGGWALAVWGGPALRISLDQKEAVDILFVLLLGLLGMAITAEAIKVIRDTDWKGIIRGLFRRGGSNGDHNGGKS